MTTIKRELPYCPKLMGVFRPLPQSHSPLCSFGAGLNPDHNFRLCFNIYF